MPNILFELTIDAPEHDVYQALTQAAGIKGWWTTDTTIKPEVGSDAKFDFGERGSLTFEVAKLNKDQHVTWNTKQGAPDWGGTSVTFDLAAQDGGTKLVFGHRNFASDGGSFASTSWSWAFFMMSLKAYIETGKGTPAGA